MLLSHFYWPNNGMVARQTYPELRDTTRRRFMEVADKRLIKTASIPEKGDGYVEWHTGGRTIFRHLDAMSEMEFGSLDLGYCAIDEITETSERIFNMLEARVGRHWKKASLPGGVFPYSPIFGAGNPNGRDWVWRLFFKPGRTVEDQQMFAGFQPQPRENAHHLPPDYYENLARGKAKWWIDRFLRGDMRTLEGLVWPQWEDDANIIRPFPIPGNWRRVMALDHGRRNPTACLWTAIDYDGNLISYREYQVAGPTAAEHAQEILKLDRREVIEFRKADPSIFAKTQSRGDKWHSIAEEYAEYGLELEPGDNAMQASLERVGLLLWQDPSHQYPAWHPKAGRPGSPRWFFFDTLELTTEAMSSWKFKEFKQPGLGLREEPVDVNDHLCDCARYTATAFPEPSREAKPRRDPTPAEWQVKRKREIGRVIREQAKDPEGGFYDIL